MVRQERDGHFSNLLDHGGPQQEVYNHAIVWETGSFDQRKTGAYKNKRITTLCKLPANINPLRLKTTSDST